MSIEDKAALAWIVAYAMDRALANHNGRGFSNSVDLANKVVESVKLHMPIHLLKGPSDAEE